MVPRLGAEAARRSRGAQPAGARAARAQCAVPPSAPGPWGRAETEAYRREARWQAWSDGPKRMYPGRGEYARDAEGDGVCAGQGKPLAGGWSLLRRWRRPHWGMAQVRLPFSLGCFALIPNVHKRDKAWRGARVAFVVTEAPGSQ
jgi:hypothetical protein